MITGIEQETLDIDWFFTNSKDIAYVASGGGKLPKSVAMSSEKNKLLVSFFTTLPITSKVVINPNLNKILSTPAYEHYFSSFVKMAEKGLFAFDKTILNNFSEPYYHLVAKPVTPLKLDQLPFEIEEIILESLYRGNMESTLDINLVS